MKTILTNQKNNLEKLTKVLGIGALTGLGFKANQLWIAEYTSADYVVKMNNAWVPVHRCFASRTHFKLFSS